MDFRSKPVFVVIKIYPVIVEHKILNIEVGKWVHSGKQGDSIKSSGVCHYQYQYIASRMLLR